MFLIMKLIYNSFILSHNTCKTVENAMLIAELKRERNIHICVSTGGHA